jgi:hypothetical protein
VAQKVWDACAIFKNQPKENNHPIGEKSPNPVTLFFSQKYVFFLKKDLGFSQQWSPLEPGLPDFYLKPKRQKYTK